jgi:GNAT superfamily N-acetyltransferase
MAKFDPDLIFQWGIARSLARQLPQPVPEFGGYRVDTYSDTERRRWVFPFMQSGLVELARLIDHPDDFIKLCGAAGELRAVLSDAWAISESGYVMTVQAHAKERDVPAGYVIEIGRSDQVTGVRILSASGALAASGYAAETDALFVYDRIVTQPEHRRKGLGAAVMIALRASIRRRGVQELLVATEQGRCLYETLGWRVVSPYTTASLARASGAHS